MCSSDLPIPDRSRAIGRTVRPVAGLELALALIGPIGRDVRRKAEAEPVSRVADRGSNRATVVLTRGSSAPGADLRAAAGRHRRIRAVRLWPCLAWSPAPRPRRSSGPTGSWPRPIILIWAVTPRPSGAWMPPIAPWCEAQRLVAIPASAGREHGDGPDLGSSAGVLRAERPRMPTPCGWLVSQGDPLR